MIGRNVRRFGLYGLGMVLIMSWVNVMLAGGFQIAVEIPDSSSDAQLKDAILLVRTYGCHQPNDATLSATAEGLVNGQRQSIPIQLTRLSSPGVYAMKQQWPADGVWVLAITGKMYNLTNGTIVKLGPAGKIQAPANGGKQLPVSLVHRKLTAQEIEAALHSLSDPAMSKPQAVSLGAVKK